jgi:hypothetical protein
LAEKYISDLPSLTVSKVTLSGDDDNAIPASRLGFAVRVTPADLINGLPECEIKWSALPRSSEHRLVDATPLLGNEHLSVVKDGKSKRVLSGALGGGRYVNVKELGARGDGFSKQQDNTAIRMALEQATESSYVDSKGQIVEGKNKIALYFPPGWYSIIGNIEVEYEGLMLVGAGSAYTHLVFESDPKVDADLLDMIHAKILKTDSLNRPNQYNHCVIRGLHIKGTPNKYKYTLNLNAQAWALLDDLLLEGQAGCIRLRNSKVCLFRDCILVGKNPDAIGLHMLDGSQSFSFDNIIMTGLKYGAFVHGTESWFRNCTFIGNSFGLGFGKAPISLLQCRFYDNAVSAVVQDLEKETGNIPVVKVTDTTFFGSKLKPTTGTGSGPLISVKYCNIDIRNSPVLGGFYSNFIELPNYYGTDMIKKVTINVDNHSRNYPTQIYDPSGIVTGRMKGTVDRQRSRAIVVDALVASRAPAQVTVDLDHGGVKNISLQAKETELLMKNSTPPTAGQELTIAAINFVYSQGKARLKMPYNFFPDPKNLKTLEVPFSGVKGARYIYQERIVALKVVVVGVPPPGTTILPITPGTLLVGSKVGRGVYLRHDGLCFFIDLPGNSNGFQPGETFNASGCQYNVAEVSGCWMPMQ